MNFRILPVHERRLLIGCPFPQIADSTLGTVPHEKRKGLHFLWKCHTAVLSETSRANCHRTLTNRPSRGRRGRFVRVVQQLACEVFAGTAVVTRSIG